MAGATRQTRCRTGCLKCRVRRRKCDETKPRCRNCIEKNFVCQYGPRLTFLKKNAFTAPLAEVSSPAYDVIEFVSENPQRYLNDATAWEKASPTDTTTYQGSSDTAIPDEYEVSRDQNHDARTQPKTPNKLPLQQTFSDGDESAVQGLLALGNTAETQDFNISEVTDWGRLHIGPSKPGCSDFFISNSTSRALPFETNNIVYQTRILQLLRHYRYEVAAWLDVCDVWQSFGISALQMAMISKATLSALLTLSEASFNTLYRIEACEPIIGDRVNPEDCEDISSLDITTKGLLTAFQTIYFFISNIPRAWTHSPHVDMDTLATLQLESTTTSINSAIYWLFVRLDISVALAADTFVKIPLPTSFPLNPSEFEHTVTPTGRVFHYAHIPLLLSAKALHFCNDEIQSPHCRTENWIALVDELDRWYRRRPQEFQPMLELDLDDPSIYTGKSFPITLFTNGAGIFGNQLYHTAMLLLLLNRPRTAKHIALQPSTMSPLWHARQICSIALNNDRRECWDLSLLASFLVAAKRMTHESQQQKVLQGFERIRALTGWDISECLVNLREEWGVQDT